MGAPTNARDRWSKLHMERTNFMDRCETYAGYTLPKLVLDSNYKQDNDSLRHDWQSVGAQAVNHLANKLMLALFAPSRPFARFDPSPSLLKQLEGSDITMQDIGEALAVAEKDIVKKLDQMACRPKLFEANKHLIVTGNTLEVMEKDKLRTFGINRYVVKRDINGDWCELILKFDVKFQELEIEAQKQLAGQFKDEDKVCLYHWVIRDKNGEYRLTQWVNEYRLTDRKFQGKYTKATVKYNPLTWDLADGDDYGTGLVELYEGDFAALSAMSEATITAAILGSEFRWMCNPGGATKPDQLARSKNGDVLPGNKDDITVLETGKMGDLSLMQGVSSDYINRIGRGFLMVQGSIRDSERTTAEEIRLLANELETGLGGVYSRLAVDWQLPLAMWLAKMVDPQLNGTTIDPVIVTGLDALSRSSDLDNLKLFLSDMAGIGSLPPELTQYLKREELIKALATARGIKSSDFVYSEQEVSEAQAAAQEQMMQQQALQTGMEAGAQQVQQGA